MNEIVNSLGKVFLQRVYAKIPDMVHIAHRPESFRSEAFQEVFRKQRSILNPIDLSIGVPEELTPEHIKAAGIAAIHNNHTVYTPANGLHELREALAEKLANENHVKVDPENVTVVPGLTTGLFLAYMALLDPGDEIIVNDPYYPPYAHLASSIGAHTVIIPSLPNFQLDLKAIEKKISPKTRAIVINTPNNPSGAVYPESDLRKLAALAEKHDIYIISDEIYEYFVSVGTHFSIGSIYKNTITMNGFSKAYAMTGWRVGYIAGPKEVIDAINQVQQYLVFSSSSIAQHAALTALKHRRRILDIYRHKREFTLRRLNDMGYEVEGGQGAYYLFIPVPVKDVEFTELAAQESLLILPGSAFSQTDNHVRISYGADLHTLVKGLDVLEKVSKGLQ
jgi:aspartate/methionine/tyrosine aminotransferase